MTSAMWLTGLGILFLANMYFVVKQVPGWFANAIVATLLAACMIIETLFH